EFRRVLFRSLAKGSDRRVPLKIEQTTVSGLVKETLASLPGAQVSVQLPHDSVVRIDSDRIQQALINMITNAQKYGGGEILLRVFVRHERTLVRSEERRVGKGSR